MEWCCPLDRPLKAESSSMKRFGYFAWVLSIRYLCRPTSKINGFKHKKLRNLERPMWKQSWSRDNKRNWFGKFWWYFFKLKMGFLCYNTCHLLQHFFTLIYIFYFAKQSLQTGFTSNHVFICWSIHGPAKSSLGASWYFSIKYNQFNLNVIEQEFSHPPTYPWTFLHFHLLSFQKNGLIFSF
jgi:hypothetical protein